MPKAFSDINTIRKMIVSAESKIVSAISFGVFWRLAPSTKPIMRSRNVSPGLEVMRILISSERTRVPPVTALRSPPPSRTTGADSPVMADSSTVAAPSMISPSPGISSPALTMTRSPLRNCSARTCSVAPVEVRRIAKGLGARLAQRIGLRFAAAFGHRFGEIGEEHREPEPERDLEQESERRAFRAHEHEHGRDRRADLGDEHDRISQHVDAD